MSESTLSMQFTSACGPPKYSWAPADTTFPFVYSRAPTTGLGFVVYLCSTDNLQLLPLIYLYPLFFESSETSSTKSSMS